MMVHVGSAQASSRILGHTTICCPVHRSVFSAFDFSVAIDDSMTRRTAKGPARRHGLHNVRNAWRLARRTNSRYVARKRSSATVQYRVGVTITNSLAVAKTNSELLSG